MEHDAIAMQELQRNIVGKTSAAEREVLEKAQSELRAITLNRDAAAEKLTVAQTTIAQLERSQYEQGVHLFLCVYWTGPLLALPVPTRVVV